MDAFINAFNATWTAMPTARARVRVNERDVIERALCSGIDLTREDSELGAFEHQQNTVRVLATAETSKIQLTIGSKVEVNCASQDEWVEVRIAGRAEKAGIIILKVEAPNE